MKIFRLVTDNIYNETAFEEQLPVLCIPDTALLIHKRPFFLPDFTQKCMVQLCLAVRISRLGRSIHRRFAHRYYAAEESTLAAHFIARDLLEKLKLQGRPWDVAVGFDNTVAVSDNHLQTSSSPSAVALRINETAHEGTLDLEKMNTAIDAQVAYISEYYTLRQGDLLLLPLPIAEQEVHIDDRLTLVQDQQEILAFNVK